MKEETKRYALIEYAGKQERVVKTIDEYHALLDNMNKYNNRKTSEFFYGDASYEIQEDGTFLVSFHVYNKLTERLTITEVDNFTTQFENERQLAEAFRNKLRTKKGRIPDINILYFENKNQKDKTFNDYDRRVKYLDILFKGDKENITRQYIEGVLYQEARDRNIFFFKELLNQFCFNPIVGEEIEKIRHYIDRCESERNNDINAENFASIYHFSKQLFNKLIRERDSKKYIDRDNNQKGTISRRRLRDFYIFTRNYDVPYEFRKSPDKYFYENVYEKVDELTLKR